MVNAKPSGTRTPAAPEIPTIRESGIAALKDFYLDNYYGFMAPPGTPPAVAAKIGADIRRLAETPDVRKKLEGAGLDMLLLGQKLIFGLGYSCHAVLFQRHLVQKPQRRCQRC